MPRFRHQAGVFTKSDADSLREDLRSMSSADLGEAAIDAYLDGEAQPTAEGQAAAFAGSAALSGLAVLAHMREQAVEAGPRDA